MFEVFSLIAGEIVKDHTLTTLAAERFNVGRSIVGGGARPGDVAIGPPG
jgi:hypothetical protein